MSVTININNLSLCHKRSGGVSIATIPDVCKTPTPGGVVPIPYPNVARSSALVKGTVTIKADGGSMCANYGSEFSRSTGDEPGTAGGVVSGTVAKEATWITHSFDVRLEGEGACRLADKMLHNHGNAGNLGGLMQKNIGRFSSLPASDCKALAEQAQEGDIVLRSTPGADSDLIRKLGKCQYSHAGIVTKNAEGKLVVVDAMPGRGQNNTEAIKEENLEDFFCGKSHGPPDKGLVARPNDPDAAKKAAEWAREQIDDSAYRFDIFSDFRDSTKDVYCSDFVHQAFQNAGVDLVPTPMDFMSDANKQNTISGIRDFAKSGGMGGKAKAGAYLAPGSKLENKIKEKINNFQYITPCQVADNAQVSKVGSFP